MQNLPEVSSLCTRRENEYPGPADQKEVETELHHWGYVSIAKDKDGNRRIVVSMRIDEELAKVLLKGSNKKQVLAELDSKLAKLSPEMQQQIQEEFNKLVELGLFVNM